MKLSKLTFRQYMALSLIFTEYKLKNKYPTLDEIKEIIGFGTDRMLDITLNALKKKGFIDYDNNSHFKIKKIVEEENSHLFLEPLILKNIKTIDFKELKKKITNSNFIPIKIQNSQFTLDKFLKVEKDEAIEDLNNKKQVVHRWGSYLEDFPPILVWEKLMKFRIKPDSLVLDPFSGSGTTLVTSKMLGINSVGIDVNPVASFTSKVKTNWNIDISDYKIEAERLISELKFASKELKNIRLKSDFLDNMGFIESHQWLKPKTQNAVAFIKESLNEIEESPLKDLLQFAFITSAVESSNVSFCPGTSFYPFRQRPTFYDAFLNKIKITIEDLSSLQKSGIRYGESTIHTEDCRNSSKIIKDDSIDFIITSPPYPNDLEYTRQTRLELFLLDQVQNLDDVQKIKKKMVKSSTKLIYKESDSANYVKNFNSVQIVADKIANALNDKKWGWDYPRMVREYFGDMYIVLKEIKKILKEDHYALLVVGDQTYKKILIPVGKILMEFANNMGFSSVEIETYRVRRSTTHDILLDEEIVILKH